MKILKMLSIFVFITLFAIGCGSSGGGGDNPPSTKTTTVSGTVLDVNGNPIQGAKVTITSTPVTVDTDSSGNFSATVEVGDHHISILVATEEIYSNDFSCSEEPYLFTAIPTQYDPNAIYPDADGDGHYSNLDCDDNNDKIHPGATEICDAIDNNCDEAVDEGVTNACGSCGAVPTEVCDGTDNNCDGTTDEGCICIDGSTQTCGTDTGECSTGIQTCVNGQWNSCSGEVGPATEICGDGLDQDCSGSDLTCPIPSLELMSIDDVNDDGKWYLTRINTITGTTTLVNTSPFIQLSQDGELYGEGTAVDLDEDVVYITGDDSKIYVIDLKTGLLLRTLNENTVSNIFFNSVGELMGIDEVGNNEAVVKINTVTGAKTIISILPSEVSTIDEGTAIDLNEDVAYITGGAEIFVIDLKTGELLRTLLSSDIADHNDYFETIFFNSAGELMGLPNVFYLGTLMKIDTITGATTIVNSQASAYPVREFIGEGTAIDTNEDVAYITGDDFNWQGGIFVIDLKTGLLLRTLDAGGETIFFHNK